MAFLMSEATQGGVVEYVAKELAGLPAVVSVDGVMVKPSATSEQRAEIALKFAVAVSHYGARLLLSHAGGGRHTK